jgi:flavin-dependent dehydrogenase
LQPITRFLTGVIGGGEVETKYDQPMSYGIRRCEFDHYLLTRSGARLQLGESLRSMRLENGEWIVNDTYHARLVIGAGGHFCPVARFTAPDADDGAPVVLAQEIEFEMNAAQRDACRVEPDRPELFFCRDLLGYGWVFRKGDYLNIGLGREREPNLSAHVTEFCEFLKQRGRVPSDITSRFHGHAYRLLRPSPRPVHHEQLLLIGDAAGLAHPQSGEGIRPAIESGLMAAQVIVEARGDYRGDLQARLRPRYAERFGADRPPSRWADRIPLRLKQTLAAFLLTTRWFSRHVLLDRWFLQRQQASLM